MTYPTVKDTTAKDPATSTTARGPRPERTLLVPLDGTDFSRRIIGQVRSLFAPDAFRITLLHVTEPPANLARPYRPAAVGLDYTLYAYEMGHRPEMADPAAEPQRHAIYEGDLDAGYRERLERDLDGEVGTFREAGYEVAASVHFGDPVAEIVALAESERVDLIAMATHARSGLGRLFRGSVAQDVLERVRIPVLLLRADEGDPVADPTGDTTSDAGARTGAAFRDDARPADRKERFQ